MRTLLIAVVIASALSTGCRKKASVASASNTNPGGGQAGIERSGGGGVMAGRRAVGRAIDASELSQFAAALEAAMKEDALTIPPKSFVLQQFKGQRGYENVIEGIQSGDIIYRDGAPRGGLWCYGKDQDNGRRHPAVVGGKATRLDAEELRQHLGS